MADTRPSGAAAWRSPPRSLRLPNGEIHVWSARLDVAQSATQAFGTYLDEEERRRASGFHFGRDRDRFVVGRGTLKAVLARYLETDPRQVRFRYGAYGKPELVSPLESSVLRFNASRSHALALYAIAADRIVGVDVERVRRNLDTEQIAGRFFSPSEKAFLDAIHPSMRIRAFFNHWTLKEAFVKATGEGLSRGLDAFEVSFDAKHQPTLLRTKPCTETPRWCLYSLTPAKTYAAAVAASGERCSLRAWQWPN